MKALTIWQPWASLIMLGVKPYEFRRWAAPRYLVGQRIVIHAGARPTKAGEIAEVMSDPAATMGGHLDAPAIAPAIELLQRVSEKRETLPLAAGLGTAILGAPKRCTEIFAGSLSTDDIDPDMWGWPLTDIETFPVPLPARGAQGFWTWVTP